MTRRAIEEHLLYHKFLKCPSCLNGGTEQQGHTKKPVWFDDKKERWFCPECFSWEVLIDFYEHTVFTTE